MSNKAPGKNEWPPSLKKWLAKSMAGLVPPAQTQAQQELKLVVKGMIDKNLVWDIDWDEQPPHSVGDASGTIKRLVAVAEAKRAPPPFVAPSPIAQYAPPPPSAPPTRDHYQQAYYAQQGYYAPPHYPVPESRSPYHANPPIPPQSYAAHSTNYLGPVVLNHQHHLAPQPPPAYDDNYQRDLYRQPQAAAPSYVDIVRGSKQTEGSWRPPMHDERPRPTSTKWDVRDASDAHLTQKRVSEDHNSHWQPEPRPSTLSSEARQRGWENSVDIAGSSKKPKRTQERARSDSISSNESEKTGAKKASPENLAEVAQAVREYLLSKGHSTLPLTKVGEFYKSYPMHRGALHGNVHAIVALPDSGLVANKNAIQLSSRGKASADKVPSASFDRFAPGSESPSKKAARAARFGNDFVLASETSSYEKIAQESQKVANALEHAVKAGTEVDWNSLVLKGTCTTLEKPFLRLTAPPDPSTVRPEHILTQALDMILSRLNSEGKSAYPWASDQMKSIRQDLRVQHIQNEFTVKVYEAHARSAIQFGNPDFQEFNQCSTQLKDLYDAGLGTEQSRVEFSAYSLLYHVYCKARYHYPSSLITLSLFRPKKPGDLADPETHAHTVHIVLDANNWTRFFRLYSAAPALGKDLLRPMVAYVRLKAIQTCCLAGKTIPKAYLCATLQLSEETEWDSFAAKYKLVMSTPDAVDAKPTLQLVNEIFSEGAIWN